MSKTCTLLLLLLMFLFPACNSIYEETSQGTELEQNSEILLNLKAEGKELSRNLSADYLKQTNLQCFLFEKDENNSSKLIVASHIKNLIYNEKLSTAIFKIPEKYKEDYKLVVLLNAENYESTKLGTTLQDFYKKVLIDAKGKTNLSDYPLFGTVDIEKLEQKIEVSVSLIRSVARVDINIVPQNPESKYHMKELKSVSVYRSRARGYGCFDEESFNNQEKKVTKPTLVPTEEGGKLYNTGSGMQTLDINEATADPIEYEFVEGSLTNNEIYLLETEQNESTKRDEALAIVVGVTLEGHEGVYYYRLDVADYKRTENGVDVSYKSVLRNHVYSYILEGAEQKGADSKEDALKTDLPLYVKIVDWTDFNISGDSLNGEYFFRLKKEEIVLDYKKDSEFRIHIETNIPADVVNNYLVMNFNQQATKFSAKFDPTKYDIIITSKESNESTDYYKDKLSLILFTQSFTVDVRQKFKTAQYYISKTNLNIEGLYIVGQELDQTNFVKVRLYGYKKDRNDISNLRFELKAKLNGGVYIDYTGVFDNLKEEVIGGIDDEFVGKETILYQEFEVPILGKIDSPTDKVLTIVTDSETISFVSVTIPVAFIQKKILGLYGTGGLKNNDNFKRLISAANFGLDKHSVVKCDALSYVESNSYDLESLIATEKPNIIIVGSGYNLNKVNVEVLKHFIEYRNELGGYNVIISLTGDESILSLLVELGIVKQQMSSEALVLLDDNVRDFRPSVKNKYEYSYRLPFLENDLIIDGAFGNTGSLSISLSNVSGIAIANEFVNMDKIKKYSGNLPYAITDSKSKKFDYALTSFRTLDYPYLFIGDSDFLLRSHPKWVFEGSKIINQEETIKDNNEPYALKTCSNGFFFANVLEWAVYTVEYGNKIKR